MAGISILRRLLMKEAMKKNAPFQNEGIMSISKALTTNVDSKVNRIVEGAKKQGIDFDKYNEQEVKYILELNKKNLNLELYLQIVLKVEVLQKHYLVEKKVKLLRQTLVNHLKKNQMKF